MTLLNGGLTQGRRIRTMNHFEFVDHFLGHITLSERQILSQLPTATSFEQLACMVVAIRSAHRQPLPPGHPLSAAGAA